MTAQVGGEIKNDVLRDDMPAPQETAEVPEDAHTYIEEKFNQLMEATDEFSEEQTQLIYLTSGSSRLAHQGGGKGKLTTKTTELKYKLRDLIEDLQLLLLVRQR
eukprot:409879-Amphidinium_carterae.1